MFATALALLASAFHGKDRGTAFGVFGATTGVAVAIGPVLGGVLTSGLSWRWIFFVNIPICLVALAVSLTRVVESKDPHAGRPGLVRLRQLLARRSAPLVYGLIEAGAGQLGATRRSSPRWSRSAVLLVVFVVSQLLQKQARCSTCRCCASRRSPAA